MNRILEPLQRLFLNRQFTAMFFFTALLTVLVIYTGRFLAPFFAALIVAYLLEGIISRMTKTIRIPRSWAVHIVFLLFLLMVTTILLWAVPEIGHQARQVAESLPLYINAGHDLILRLPKQYPDWISPEQAKTLIDNLGREISSFAKNFLSGGVIAPLVWLLTVVIYLILVPVMVYFMLKDKHGIMRYLRRFLPFDNPFMLSVWQEVDRQIGNYILGKFTEILVVWFSSYIVFIILHLNYAMLLSFMVGLSVLIPYIGATVVTIPVLLVALVQWGLGSQFYILVGAYLIIQILDGNVLAPLIFSGAVNIHPVAIIVSVLLFGGIWGFWGVFFAIPLATVVNAIINAWQASLKEE